MISMRRDLILQFMANKWLHDDVLAFGSAAREPQRYPLPILHPDNWHE
jgi:hypothetical protein